MLIALAMLFALAACRSESNSNVRSPATKEAMTENGDWMIGSGWKLDGAALELDSKSFSSSFFTASELKDAFTVSALISALDKTEEAGIGFGSKDLSAAMNVKIVTDGAKAFVKAGYFLGEQESEALSSDSFDIPASVTLTVTKQQDDRSLYIKVLDGETELYSGQTAEIPALAVRSARYAGVCGTGSAKVSDFSVEIEEPYVAEEVKILPIEPKEHVDNQDYLFGKAICNKDADGNDIIIVDNQEGEAIAWNVANELGEAWTVRVRAQAGKSAEETGVVRFALGGDFVYNGNFSQDMPILLGLVTLRVNNGNNTVLFENAQEAGSAWLNTAGSSDWLQMGESACDVVISRRADEYCLYIQVLDVYGEELYAVKTADYTPEILDAVKYIGFTEWQTQAQFTNIMIDCNNAADIQIKGEELVAGITDEAYLSFDLTQKTDSWELTPTAHWQPGTEKGDAILANSSTDLTAKYKTKLGKSFTISMDINYLRSFADTQHSRFFFWAEDGTLPFLMDIRTNCGYYFLGAQYMDNGNWSDNMFADVGGALLDEDISITISRTSGSNKIHVTLIDTDGSVLAEADTIDFPTIDDIAYLELHSSECVTIFDNITVE